MAKNPLNTLGASNLSEKERSDHDYYGTDPRTTRALLNAETFSHTVWEPCAGHHLIVNELVNAGYEVDASDLFEYDGYSHRISDFLSCEEAGDSDIVTNPPYNLSTEFVEHALKISKPGRKICMLLRLQFLEGSKRYNEIFKINPPKTIYVFTNRQVCSKQDDFTEGSAVAYCWIVWEKGYAGKPTIEWLSTKE